MKKNLKKIVLVVLISLFAMPVLLASPGLTKDETFQITNASSWYGSYGDLYLSSLSYSQDNVITYNGWQYAAYYDTNRYVAVARRQLPDGSWSTLSLTDYHQTTNDTHNNISMGISPDDGRIHLAFDHHDSTLHYRMSVSGLANNPTGHSWISSKFNSVQNHLNSGTITSFTYPRFMVSSDDVLLFEGRIGGSGDGDSYLWKYDDDGTWTTLGKFIEGGSANAYFHGIMYEGTRLHAAWCWRESSDGNTNHDLMYAYSDDDGYTWRNNGGSHLSTTGSDPILMSDSYKVYTINQSTGLINQEGMIVDAQGRVHVISRETVSGANRQMHYYRNTAGTWNKINTGIRTTDWDNRSKIAYDSSGNVYAIMPNLRIASASVSSSYSNWTLIINEDYGVYAHAEPLIDRMGLLSDSTELYVYVQRGTPFSGDSKIDVIRYDLNTGNMDEVPTPPSGFTWCASEGNSYSLPGTCDVAYGAEGTFYYKYNVSGSITFNNANFGDAINGVAKAGYYKVVGGGSNLALNQTVTYSSQQSGNEADHAVDGSISTRWSADTFPEWIVVDLGATFGITKTEIAPYYDRAYRYTISVSTNGTNYTQIVDRTSNTQGGSCITDNFNEVDARYVKLNVTGVYNSGTTWVSILEFRVFE